jgi:cellulose biosynthesis protein BcsQ
MANVLPDEKSLDDFLGLSSWTDGAEDKTERPDIDNKHEEIRKLLSRPDAGLFLVEAEKIHASWAFGVDGANIGELRLPLQDAARQGVNLVIIDTPAKFRRELIDVYRLSELILMPVKPAVWDIAALRETLEVLSLSRTSAQSTAITTQLDKTLAVPE